KPGKIFPSAFIFILFLLSFLALSTSTYAQAKPSSTPLSVPNTNPPTGINLNLSPTFLNLKTDPGKSISSEFRVRNNNSFNEYLKLSLVKFVNGPTGNPVIADLPKGDEFATWISFNERQFVLSPGQSKVVKFTISPSNDAALGYYYAILVSRIKKTQGQGAVISGSTALPVLLDVKSPNAKREVQLLSFKTDKLFYEYLPVQFQVSFKNTGNIHVSPIGDIFIDSLFNQEVGVLKVNEGHGNILPNGERTFSASWRDGFAVRSVKTEDGVAVKDDKGNDVYETHYDFSKANLFRFGRYSANVLMVYDNGERD